MSATAVTSTTSVAPATRAWQLWSLIKQELLYLSWALMDVAIMTPIALTIMRWGRFWPAGQVTLWLLLLMLLPFNLVRALSAFQMTARMQKRIVMAALFLTLLFMWRGLLYAPRPLIDFAWLGEFFGRVGESADPQWARDLTVFIFVLLAWWRGLRLAQLTPDIYRAGFRLRAGGLLLAPIAFFLHGNEGGWTVTPFILLYFLAGLTAVALIRAEQIERDRSGFAASLTPGWVAAIFAASLLVVLSAGLLAAIFGGDPAAVLSGWLAPLWAAGIALGTVALLTFVYLLTPALNALTAVFAWVAGLIGGVFSGLGLRLGLDSLADPDSLLPFDIPGPAEPASLFTLPDPVSRTAIILVMLAVAGLLSYFLTRYFRQVQQAPRTGTTGARIELAGEEDLNLAERILDRLGLWRRRRTAATIRSIYTNMCRAAAAVGYPRAAVATPYEYLSTLAEVWPANTADSRLITEAFIRVRYGQLPETKGEVAAIKTAWQRLSTTQPAVSADVSDITSLPHT